MYKTIPTNKLSSIFKDKLQQGDFQGIVFFSSESAKIFSRLLKKEGLEKYIKDLNAFCLSPQIAKNITNYGFKATMYPKNPNISAIIKLLINFQFK